MHVIYKIDFIYVKKCVCPFVADVSSKYIFPSNIKCIVNYFWDLSYMFHSSHWSFHQCKFSCYTLFDQSSSGVDLELPYLCVSGYLNKHFCKIKCRTFAIFRSFTGRCAVDDWLWVFIRHCMSFCTHIAKMFSILFHEFECSTISNILYNIIRIQQVFSWW